MRRTFSVAAAGLLIGVERAALGMGGNLDEPSIAVPVDPGTKAADPVARKILDVLQAHEKGFTGGWFINSHSELYFAGGTKGVNALLGDLAKVEGAAILVRLSKEAGATRRGFPAAGAQAESPCDLKVDHLGWGDARAVTLTVDLGGGRVDPAELELPAIAGRAPPAGK